MAFLIVLTCVLLLFCRAQVYLHDERKKVVGCSHNHGTVLPVAPNLQGRPGGLQWFCDSCPLQFPIQVVYAGKRGDDTLWLYHSKKR